MEGTDTMTAERDDLQSGTPSGGSPSGGSPPKKGRGLLTPYKQEQGRRTRIGTMIAFGLLVLWGGYFVWEQLRVYEGDEGWRLLITPGIPLLFTVVLGGVLWWFVFAHRTTGDFMIATEGEMKKVNWSTKREVIGSTKVVILFTILIASYLFLVDIVFQNIFRWIGVLKG
jgi:preprotein translocase subunit SecE